MEICITHGLTLNHFHPRVFIVGAESTPNKGDKVPPKRRGCISWTTTLYAAHGRDSPAPDRGSVSNRRVRIASWFLTLFAWWQSFNGSTVLTVLPANVAICCAPCFMMGVFFMQIRVTNNIQSEHGNVILHSWWYSQLPHVFSYI